jgi:hypothetical protein
MLNAVARVALMPLRNPIVLPQKSFQIVQSSLNGQTCLRYFKTNTTLLNQNDKHFIRRARERIGLKDRAMAPTEGTPFKIGLFY